MWLGVEALLSGSREDQLSRYLSCKEQRRQNKTHGRNIKSTQLGHMAITMALGKHQGESESL